MIKKAGKPADPGLRAAAKEAFLISFECKELMWEWDELTEDDIEKFEGYAARIIAAANGEAEATISLLRRALEGLVGETDPDELRKMEAMMRMMPAPDADKAVTINAIHALLAVAQERSSA